MDIDHIFIFTNTQGKIAEDLIAFGFSANESRVHKGQGTMNRTFSFKNFYLEIAWVINESELKSEFVKPTGLWQRAEYFANEFSPFGLVIVNNEASDLLFFNALKYQPAYFSKGSAFEIITNQHRPGLPWTCRMPLGKEQKKSEIHVEHNNKILELSKASFEYLSTGDTSFVDQFSNEKTIAFVASDRNWLTLNFDSGVQRMQKTFPQLLLTIQY